MGQQHHGGPGGLTPDVEKVLGEVDRHLSAGRPQAALDAASRPGGDSPWLANAAAVCKLRLERPREAVEVLRRLATTDGVRLVADAPAAFKVNLAAALLASDNLDGYRAVIGQLRDADHPAVAEVRGAYAGWKSSLPLGQKVRFALLGEATPPFRFTSPPGVLR